MFAVASGSVGAVWDVSWHKSIGRDAFLTPAHVLIYLCGIVAGLSCGYVILAATFGRGEPRAGLVKMWGFRGPLGAFLCSWGALAMIASAPLDNWWHNAYGLDVKVLSPPHILLALGLLAIRFGALALILGRMNQAGPRARRILEALLIYAVVCLITVTLGAFQEKTLRIFMHSAQFYVVVCGIAPLWLALVSMVSGGRWAATVTAAVYTAYVLAFVWILPLFPAEPRLGPVYNPVTRFVPPDFPLLLLAPALAFDLLRHGAAKWPRWRLALAGGALFTLVFAAAQWPFAAFLESPASRNRLFATGDAPYFVPPDSPYVRHVFVALERSPGEFWTKMALACALAAIGTALGLRWGDNLRRLRR